MAKQGRPTLCTPEITSRISNAVRQGHFLRTAAELYGVSPSTVAEWQARGRGTDDREEAPEFAHFAASIEKARAEASDLALGVIRRSMLGGREWTETRTVTHTDGGVTNTTITRQEAPQWPAAAWWFERTHRQLYGRNVVTAAEGELLPGATADGRTLRELLADQEDEEQASEVEAGQVAKAIHLKLRDRKAG